MKLGVVFPQTEIGSDPAIIREYAQAAEDLGYDYLLAYDHILGANPERPGGWTGPYTYRETFHEPLVLFGYLAALTRRIELVSGIIILPQRQTVLVAKQAAEVDVLSGGRLRLGVGLGWNTVEYEALNEDFHTRGRRVEEQVALLRELWAKPLVTFKGESHTVSDAGLNPMPVQQPIPLWFGGHSEPAVRRIARIADGWIANTMPFDKLKPQIDRLLGLVAEARRDPSTFGIDVRVSLRNTSQNEWAGEVERWRGAGVSHLCFNTMNAGLPSPRDHIDMIRQFKAEIG